MERTASKIIYEGKVVTVRIDSFRSKDGSTREREMVAHPGAVAIAAHDEAVVFLVRQPREAVEEEALLELPAGKLDVDGETPLQCARRELEEEVGLRAAEWRELKRFYSSPGFTDEEVHVFEATGLERVEARPDEGEELEVVEWALSDLGSAIDTCADAKSLIGLTLLHQRLNR
jgi:8-oxo-dGTP pyrophosphatase MutT (NUDIX family)